MRMNLPVTGRDVSISDTANILSTTDLNGDITVAFAPGSLTVTCATM